MLRMVPGILARTQTISSAAVIAVVIVMSRNGTGTSSI